MSTNPSAYELGVSAAKLLRKLMQVIGNPAISQAAFIVSSRLLPVLAKDKYADLYSTPAFVRNNGVCLQTWYERNVCLPSVVVPEVITVD